MVLSANSTQIGCILWENTFVRIEKQDLSTHEEYIFTVHTRQSSGWMGVGIYTKPNIFDGSINVVGFLPNNVVELKNHTTQVTKKSIFGETFQNILFNTIDGTFTFAFILNSSQVQGKNYFAFAQNSFQTPTRNNDTLEISKHQSFSRFQYFEFNSSKNVIPVCRNGLNISARITGNHPLGYAAMIIFYCIVIILMFWFRNEQPFRSRFASPYISTAAVFINLVLEEIFGILPYYQSSPNYCWFVGFLTYGPLQMATILPLILVFRYFILLRIHKRKRQFIKKLKKNTEIFEENVSRKFNYPKFILNSFLKIVSSRWITLAAPLIYTTLYCLATLFIYAIYSFKCDQSTYFAMRYLYFGMNIWVYCMIALLICIDFIFNIRWIFTCKCKKIFVDDDPFNFRLDIIMIFVLVPTTVAWAFLPLPKYLYSVLTELNMFLAAWVTGWQTLVITMIKKLIFLIKEKRKSNKPERNIVNLNYCISPEVIDTFIAFCESEWSIENILCKLDILKYRSLKSKSERKKISKQIQKNYLTVGVSELEINCPHILMNETIKEIEKEEFEDDLFRTIERTVDVNLVDTISRFRFSYMYDAYVYSLEKQTKDLGL